MNRQLQRVLHKQNIYGSHKPKRISSLLNSFGRAIGERAPDYRSVRHLCYLCDMPTSHREVKREIASIKNKLGLPS